MKKKYYKKSASEAIRDLKTSKHGLREKEVKKRLSRFGENKLPEAKPDSLIVIFFRQFKSPLIFILLLAAVIVFWTGEHIDGIVILFILLFNAIIGTIQEGKAQNIFASLKNFTKTKSSVIRGGRELIIPSEEVVPGDIVVLREGEKVSADARLLYANSLQASEAAITGESTPRFKTVKAIKKTKVSTADQTNMVFKGTNVTSGSGRAVVVATGINTVIGKIAEKITTIDEDLPLKKDIRLLSRLIIATVLIIAVALFFLGLFYGYQAKDIFAIIVAVSVSVIPEGLPIVVTLVLAMGVWRMGKHRVLVKKMQAVEALGQTNVIAVDKTGTVTKNELAVKEVRIGGKVFLIKGVGYDAEGEIDLDGEVIEPLNHPELLMAGKISSLCSSANLVYDEKSGDWKTSGDPTEVATLVLSNKVGFQKMDLEREFTKIEERPFDYKLKYHAVLHRGGGNYLLSVVGAPEEILGVSKKIWNESGSVIMTKEEKEKIKSDFIKMSKRGLRVVALGVRYFENKKRIPERLPDLDFVALLGIKDSPRAEVEESVNKVKAADIKLVMITGDHKFTAKAVAEEVGIFKKGDKMIEGAEIDEMSEEELSEKLERVSVFARVSPFHKLKIVDAYKLSGKVIAMTGDGVNDALSLTAADVGVAMGKIGTEVAKEASDIVLLDDDFGNIVSVIEEGRNIFKTIKKVILYLFSTSIGELFTIFGALLLGFPLPLLAVQILWLNLVTDGFLDVALAMEKKGDNLVGRKFLKRDSALVDKLMVLRIFIMAVPMAIGALFLFGKTYQADINKALTMSFTVLAVFQWFNVWNCRSHVKSIFNSGIFSNKFLIGATGIVIALQLLAVYNPFFQKFLGTVPLNAKEWAAIIAIAFSIVVVEEVRKVFYRKIKKI